MATTETTENSIDALLEIDRLVRLMACASEPAKIVGVVQSYLCNWSKDRILRLQAMAAGWVPFDAWQRPFTIRSESEVRQIRGAVRIRCRELDASGIRISPELMELDLFLFFAMESIDAHGPMHGDAAFADVYSIRGQYEARSHAAPQ